MKMTKKKVLVTGADGFIGSHLVEELIRRGNKVRAFVYYNSFNSWGWLDTFSKQTLAKIEIFSGDIRDPNGVMEACRGVEVVYHLAALIGIPFSYHSPDSYVDTNIKGTLNVLQAGRQHKLKKIIHTSTSEIYGTAQYVPIDEKHPVNPQSPYAATKSGADELALTFYRSFNLPVSILRPFNTFGPRQSARAVIPTIITQALSGEKVIKLGNTSAKRDFNYVSNTVDGFISIAESSNTNGEIFNVGSGREVTVEEVAQMIREITGKNFKIQLERARLRPRKSEVERLQCDASKLQECCAWNPKVDLEKGLQLTCGWIKKNLDRYKADIYNI
jgi:NAD dependent epimerase/dehydratase